MDAGIWGSRARAGVLLLMCFHVGESAGAVELQDVVKVEENTSIPILISVFSQAPFLLSWSMGDAPHELNSV